MLDVAYRSNVYAYRSKVYRSVHIARVRCQ